MKRGSTWALGVVIAMVGCGSSSGGSEGTSGSPPTAEPTPPASRATGEIGEWQAAEPLPTPRANHCAVAVGEWLVVIGGNHKPKGAASFVDLDDVLVAKIGADGSVGAWTVAGRAPGAVSSCTAATDGKSVFLVDGIYANESIGKVVRRASLSPDGALGAWQDMGALPDGVRVLYSYASVSNGSLRAFHSRLPDDGDAISLLRASASGDTLASWAETTWLTGFRGHPQYALAEVGSSSFAYALGGYSGAESTVLATGAAARLDESGAPGQSFEVPALPKPTAFGKAIAVDDWLFVVGGKDAVFSASGRADVFAAQIAADGSLSSWSTKGALPQGRTSHALARSGDYLFVTGGGYDAGGLATVFSARVRFAP